MHPSPPLEEPQTPDSTLRPISPTITITTVRTHTGHGRRHRNSTIHLRPTLRHSTPHLPGQHIPEPRERLALPLQILIAALHKLHELARVDVRVARCVDVVNYLWWELDA